MKKITTLVLCVMFASALFSVSLLANDAKDLIGQTVFTRTNLKNQGRTIYFHNMSKTKGFIPVGTPVIIKSIAKDNIRFQLAEGDAECKTYIVKALSAYYDRYFVKSTAEIGLKKMSSSARGNIKTMVVVPGMTKEEVYVSRGCPAFIDWGVKSWAFPLDEIMESDTWYYNAGTSKIEMLVTFKNGVVAEIS